MATPPNWLPDLVDTDGSWDEVLPRLYAVFYRDFHAGRPTLGDLRITWDTTFPDGGPYEDGFWHLIQRMNYASGEREPDFPRAQRIGWCGASIRNFEDPAVVMFDYSKGKKRPRTYLWLKDFDYVVVIEKQNRSRGRVAHLITAYHIDGESQRRRFRKMYEQRCS